MSARRLLIVGNGRMGKAIATLARERGDEVVAVLGSADNADGRAIAAHATRAEVAIEFTTPATAEANVRACLAAGLPVVCGTTGWNDALAAVSGEVRAGNGALLAAANFSLGVALLAELAERAGVLFAPHPQYDGALVETHHTAKRDAPSGTALALGDAVTRGLGRALPITSVRVGHVPGTHTLLFDGPFEQIRLTHEARGRRVFADGAWRAAHWIVGRQGVFTLRDVLSQTP